jgi:hypothetical protein
MTGRFQLHDSDRFSHQEGEAAADYRAVSIMAVVGLVLACLSSFALLSDYFVAIPVLGVVFSAAAWIRIAHSDGKLVGRPAAVFGTIVSAFFVAAVVGNAVTWNYWLTSGSKRLAQQWIDYLRDDQPERAFLLLKYDSERQATDVSDAAIWDYYRRYPVELEALRRFVNTDGVRDLLALGRDATVRHWATEEVHEYENGVGVSQVYAITYGEPGSRTTFFCRLLVWRRTHPSTGEAEWRILNHAAGVTPGETDP